ncbi:MAG: lytic transglycosylase domain-containing protein [Fretibacterium sp.]|nr:lytic transglycosylase domain-containing protein [Fretibacterium sp.]
MIGPDLTRVNQVLSRIEQIVQQSMPNMPPVQPVKNRFVDVLDEVAGKKAKAAPKSGKVSYEELQEVIDRCADRYNVDQELIRAMIQVESGWKTDAVSSKGAQGLMQLMPRTAAMLGVSDPLNPEQNIEGGVKYISDLTDKYRGDVEKALAAYNAGPGRVDAGKIPSVSSRYVKNVMALYHRIREQG